MPSQAKKISIDTAAIFVARIASLLLGLVRLKYIAIYLGVETFGIYTFAVYFVAMFSIFFDVGLGQILTRDISADKERTSKYVSSALYLKIILFVATAGIISAATFVSHFNAITNWAVAFSIFITGTTSLSTVFTGAFQAHRKMRLLSVITVATDFSTSVAVIALLILGYGLFGLMIGSAAVTLIMFLATLYLARRSIKAVIGAPSIHLWKYLFKEGYPVAIGALGITLYMYVTSALLKYISGNVAAGYYNAAFKIISILTVIPVSFDLVIYPFFAELFVSEREKLRSVLNSSIRYMLIISIPMAVGTILIADKLIATLYTKEFLPSVPALQLLILSSMISYANYVLYTFLPAINEQRFGMYVTIPTGVAVAVVNYLMIGRFGLLVPASSLVAVEIILFAAAYFYLGKLGYRLSLSRLFVKPFLACLPMAALLVVTRNTSILFQIPAAALVYALSFYFMKGILKEDKEILEKILPTPIRGKVLKYI